MNPESLQIQICGLLNLDLRVRTLRICITDLIRRPFFKRFVFWIRFVRPKISNYLICFDLEGFVYESRNLNQEKLRPQGIKATIFFQLSEARLCFNKTGPFRLLEIWCDKIISICCPSKKMKNLSRWMSHRIEEVPEDQVIVRKKEMLVPVQHAQVSKTLTDF